MKKIIVDMPQFRKNWVTYSDNYHIAEAIEAGKGTVLTISADSYLDHLCDFNIFFTIKEA